MLVRSAMVAWLFTLAFTFRRLLWTQLWPRLVESEATQACGTSGAVLVTFMASFT
jgi:hypothetical protein